MKMLAPRQFAKQLTQKILRYPDDLWPEAWIMRRRLGYWPNLKSPQTFNEKIAYRKLRQYDPRYSTMADKYLVRDYVTKVLDGSFLNGIYLVAESVDQADLSLLPQSFVVKATHDNGSVLVVDDKDGIDEGQFYRRLNDMLCRTFGQKQFEYWYLEIPPRLLFEERLRDDQWDIPLDYKFFVFHGKVKMIEVDFSRFMGHQQAFYSEDWEEFSLTRRYPKGPSINPPHLLREMINASEQLARDFDFARIDLYCPNDKRIVFGEMTFAPGSGRVPFTPRSFDSWLGSFW